MIPGDPAFYRGTDVLVNHYDIRDPVLLKAIEYKFSSVREVELSVEPIEGKFNYDYLLKIHKHLFQDVYAWAGTTRNIDFAKKNEDTQMVNRFSRVDRMPEKIRSLNQFIKDNNEFKGLSKKDFIPLFAQLHARLNEIHPFREGNGRATRLFMTQIAKEAGYEFSLKNIDSAKWNLASHKALTQFDPKNPNVSYQGSNEIMQTLLGRAVNPTSFHAFQYETKATALLLYPHLIDQYKALESIEAKVRLLYPATGQNSGNNDAALILSAKMNLIKKIKINYLTDKEMLDLDNLANIRPGTMKDEAVHGVLGNGKIIEKEIIAVFKKQGFNSDEVKILTGKFMVNMEKIASELNSSDKYTDPDELRLVERCNY